MAQSESTVITASGLAVRSITTDVSGGTEIGFSFGSPTAPAGQSGTVAFRNQEHMMEWLVENGQLTQFQLLAVHLGMTYVKSDGTLANPNQVLNKELRFDVFAPNPLRIV